MSKHEKMAVRVIDERMTIAQAGAPPPFLLMSRWLNDFFVRRLTLVNYRVLLIREDFS